VVELEIDTGARPDENAVTWKVKWEEISECTRINDDHLQFDGCKHLLVCSNDQFLHYIAEISKNNRRLAATIAGHQAERIFNAEEENSEVAANGDEISDDVEEPQTENPDTNTGSKTENSDTNTGNKVVANGEESSDDAEEPQTENELTNTGNKVVANGEKSSDSAPAPTPRAATASGSTMPTAFGGFMTAVLAMSF